MANAPLPHYGDHDPTGRYGPSSDTPVRIGVLGDSSMTGPGLADRTQVWMARLADRLPFGVDLRSHARGGSRVRDVLVGQAPDAIADRPDLFVVSVGANDALHGTSARQFARDLDTLLDLLRLHAPVVSLGVGNLSVIPRLPLTLRPVVARRSATFDRVHARLTQERERVVRVPVGELADPFFIGRDLANFVGDLFHPSGRIHAVWAELFEPYVRAALAPIVEPLQPTG
jgi:lysophospholipase L1-like esterase